jgi:DMSO/TMAO reductase YedYZ molybdopterin-dependent catalytic subunit
MWMATKGRMSVRNGIIAGAASAVVMILAQGIARLGAGVPMFPDLLEDLATRLIPPPIFARVLDTLHFQAKPLLFLGLLVAQIVAGAIVGGVFSGWLGPRSRGLGVSASPWGNGLLLALALWLATGVVILPVAGQGVFGSQVAIGPLALNVVLVVGFVLFGLTSVATMRIIDDASAAATLAEGGVTSAGAVASPERRRLLGGVAVGAVAVVAAGAAYRVLGPGQPPMLPQSVPPLAPVPAESPVAVPSPAPAIPTPEAGGASVMPAPVVASPTPLVSTGGATPSPVAVASTAPDWAIKGLASEVTSTQDFYKVSKNFFSDPEPDPKEWTLQVTGLVNKPYTIHYADLLKLPAIERYQTLQCISNEIGGDLIGNALWRGASLSEIIRAAEPKPGAIKVVFTAADGYQDSITLDRALSPNNVVAHTMNGEPLVAGHGMPARLLIPGIYGMKNVKWITKIELMATDFKGYWQQRGWSDDAFIHTMSRIDVPSPDQGTPKVGPVEVAGVAFGGDKGISKVEVSADDGATWHEAVLKGPLGPFTWRLWRLDWNAKAGEHHLTVRATNGAGELQTSKVTDTIPDGATGLHTVTVTVTS